MTIPVLVLLAFAVWTLFILLVFVGSYRWSKILTRKAQITSFAPVAGDGTDFYQRAMRAHANCLENLPVFAAIVVAAVATGVSSPLMDRLAIALLVARICQTLIHITFRPGTLLVFVRFLFFFVQIICMLWMAIYIALNA